MFLSSQKGAPHKTQLGDGLILDIPRLPSMAGAHLVSGRDLQKDGKGVGHCGFGVFRSILQRLLRC